MRWGTGASLTATTCASRRRPSPTSPSSLRYSRGITYAAFGQYDKALADYQTALEVAPPSYAGAHNALAWLLATCPEAKRRDPNRAVKLAQQAVQLAPKDANCWGTLGTAHYRA